MENKLTLGSLLFGRSAGAPDLRLDDNAAFGELLQRLPSLGANRLTEMLSGALAELLDVNVLELLVGSWLKHRELIEATKDGGNGTLVELGAHSFSSSHKPKVEVVLNGATVSSIDIEIELSLTLGLAQLLVQGPYIRELRLGELKCKGALSIEGQEVLSKPLAEVDIPGKFTFEPGLPVTLEAWRERMVAIRGEGPREVSRVIDDPLAPAAHARAVSK